MSDVALAEAALRCLDLTDLSDSCSDLAVEALCAKAVSAPGPVAAVCVWPQHVSRARRALEGSAVRLATVMNFPGGDTNIERVLDDVAEALTDGAGEIDLVLPYRAFLAGDVSTPHETVAAVRDVIGDRVLKVIIESGALGSEAAIAGASRLAIAAGADFVKTSTGKTAVSATPEAAGTILDTIATSGRAASGRGVGLKVSGGIRTLADARAYIELASARMGQGFIRPERFRIGASGLYDALVAAIEGRPAAAQA